MSADNRLEELIRVESNHALELGALLAFGISATVLGLDGVLSATRGMPLLRTVFPACVTAVSALTWVLARRGAVYGNVARTLLLGTAAVPFGYLALCEAILPFGGATYFFAPVVWSYFLIVIVSAFLMDARLSQLTGALSAAGYLAAWFLFVRPHFETVVGLDPAFRDDLASTPVHVVRTVLLLGAGLLAGGVCTTARRLLSRARDEEREKMTISRVFGEYVSPEVKDKLLAELTNLRGERRRVAVLFSDLRGFTAFSEGKEPHVVVERLNQYFDRMVFAISKHGGTVDKFIGDAVMATFGGLIPVANPSGAAIAAAEEMRRELAALNVEWGKQGLAPLENGIGVHFGDVLQGPIGSATRKEFTVIGDVVNTASRLESASKELMHPIVVSSAARAELDEASRGRLKSLGEVKLKGKAEAVEVWGA